MTIKDVLLASRIPYATASVLPVVFTAVFVSKTEHKSDLLSAALAFFGVLFCHLGSNTFNDYYDWNESDKINRFPSMFNGGSRKAFEHIFNRKAFLIMSLVYFGLCTAILIALMAMAKYWLLPIALISGGLAGLYSFKPVSLQSRGIGEIAILFAFGPLITLGTGYAITGELSLVHFLLGIPQGILTCAIIWINEFPDFSADKTAGKKNMVVQMGLKASIYGYLALYTMYTVSIVSLIAGKVLPVLSLLALLILPVTVISIAMLFKVFNEPLKVNKIQANTVLMQGLGSILLIVSLLF